MKTSKTRSLFETHRMLCAIIMTVMALTFTTCEGPMGPQGETGESSTPYVGDNGNWWINGVDTGVLAVGVISVTRPTKTGYSQYESFTSAGLVVQAYFTDGSTVTVNSGYNLYWNDTLLIDGNYAISAETGVKTITVEWQKKVATFEIRVLAPSDNFQVYDESSWNDVLNLIINSGSGTAEESKGYVIEVIDDFGIAGTNYLNPTFGDVSNVSVRLIGEGKLYLSSQGSLFYIGVLGNQSLIIDSAALTLEGFASNTTSLVYVYSNGTLELRNGTISGNNSNTSRGGGVYVYDNGSFTMSGGYISGNSASFSSGGGVAAYYGGSFIMNGGTISGNFALYGGGVEIDNGGFTKTSGIIYGNGAGANSNTADWGDEYGHAVVYFDASSGVSNVRYYRDTTLNVSDDISTSDALPTSSGQTLNGWTRQ